MHGLRYLERSGWWQRSQRPRLACTSISVTLTATSNAVAKETNIPLPPNWLPCSIRMRFRWSIYIVAQKCSRVFMISSPEIIRRKRAVENRVSSYKMCRIGQWSMHIMSMRIKSLKKELSAPKYTLKRTGAGFHTLKRVLVRKNLHIVEDLPRDI